MSVLEYESEDHIKHQYCMWIKLDEKYVEVFDCSFEESDDSIKHVCYFGKIVKNFKSCYFK